MFLYLALNIHVDTDIPQTSKQTNELLLLSFFRLIVCAEHIVRTLKSSHFSPLHDVNIGIRCELETSSLVQCGSMGNDGGLWIRCWCSLGLLNKGRLLTNVSQENHAGNLLIL